MMEHIEYCIEFYGVDYTDLIDTIIYSSLKKAVSAFNTFCKNKYHNNFYLIERVDLNVSWKYDYHNEILRSAIMLQDDTYELLTLNKPLSGE